MTHSEAFSSSPVKASSIIGAKVANYRDENLGEIEDIVIDRHIGKVAYIIVSSGGFLGMGKKLLPIPFSALSYNAVTNIYAIDISLERLKTAPGFDSGNWPTMCDKEWNSAISSFYERPLYWE
jgi:sporulation protein YlmC with PRC-barrel domain